MTIVPFLRPPNPPNPQTETNKTKETKQKNQNGRSKKEKKMKRKERNRTKKPVGEHFNHNCHTWKYMTILLIREEKTGKVQNGHVQIIQTW